MTDERRLARTRYDVALAHVARRAVDDLQAATELEQTAYDDTVRKVDASAAAARRRLSARPLRRAAWVAALVVGAAATWAGHSWPAGVLLACMVLHLAVQAAMWPERAASSAADDLGRCTEVARAAERRLRAISDAVERAAAAAVMQLHHVTAAAAQLVLRSEDLLPVMVDGPPCQPDRLVRALVAAPAAPPAHGHGTAAAPWSRWSALSPC